MHELTHMTTRAKSSVARATIFGLVALIFLSFGASPANSETKSFGVEYDTDFTQITHYDGKNEPYEVPLDPLKKDPLSYIQPWGGYCNTSDRPEDEAKRLPCQTYNIKPAIKYAGVEIYGNKWMKLACDEARISAQKGGGPFSSVIVQIDDQTNKVLRYWISHNAVVKWNDPTAHGETTAIRQACQELGVLSLGLIRKDDPNLKLPQTCKTSHCELYTSAEPCPMCYAATRWARIDKIYFAATVYDAAAQGVNFSDEPIYAELSLPYKDRQKMGVWCYQCTLDNSLDAFNHYKRLNATKY
ncbi:MAG: nucleoside deaminase [Candidatus Obscuribacterales bacterium]|nr:nucleoside deaminase [Candidatus Obscuribacterales bacterium]